MAFKILIVEDEALFADQMEMLIDKLGYDHLGTIDNSEAALNSIQQNRPDLILMDIHINGNHDGIELAEMIHKDHAIPIIFITSLKDDLTFSRASRSNPIQFLLKPFDQLQLQRTIEVCVKQLSEMQPEQSTEEENWENDFLFGDHFFIKTRQRLEKVHIEDVLFLETDGHYCQVHTSNKKFLVRMSLNELSKRLPPNAFIQTHRSFLVKMDKVTSVDLQDSVIHLIGDKQVPMSKRNKEVVLKELNWI